MPEIQDLVAQIDVIVKKSVEGFEEIKTIKSFGDLIAKAEALQSLATEIVKAVKQVADESSTIISNEEKLQAATTYLSSIIKFGGFWAWLNFVKKPILDLILSLAWQAFKPKDVAPVVQKKRTYKKAAK